MQPRVPSAAFGGEVAQAVSGLGHTVAGAGDEIFSRAIALQNIQNEAEATEADAKYMIEAGKIHADFNAKEGNERVQAFPKYQQDLQDIRQKIRGGLTSPMSQKMFDRSSLSTMGRTIFTKTFQDKIQQARHNAITIAAAKGFEPGSAQEQLLIQQATSNLWSSKIDGKSRTDPYTANRWLSQHRTELTDDDYHSLSNTVRNQSRAIDSVNIANEVYDAGKAGPDKPGKSLGEMEEEAVAKAKEHDPDDPLLVQHTRSVYYQQKDCQRSGE